MTGESNAVEAPSAGASTVSADGEGEGRTPSYDEMIDLVAHAFESAAEHEHYGPRMAQADTTIALDFGERGLTVRLDREPIEVEDGLDPDAESSISGTEEEWMPIFIGGNIGIALARGELQWTGPVRKFLRIFPIFRHVYATLARGDRVQSTEQRNAEEDQDREEHGS